MAEEETTGCDEQSLLMPFSPPEDIEQKLLGESWQAEQVQQHEQRPQNAFDGGQLPREWLQYQDNLVNVRIRDMIIGGGPY